MSTTIELPDFDDMFALSLKIADVATAVENYKHALTSFKADITVKTTENPEYWIGGKPPSVSYIKDSYHIIGYDDETRLALESLTASLAINEVLLDQLKRDFSLMSKQIEVWRTLEANKRHSVE